MERQEKEERERREKEERGRPLAEFLRRVSWDWGWRMHHVLQGGELWSCGGACDIDGCPTCMANCQVGTSRTTSPILTMHRTIVKG